MNDHQQHGENIVSAVLQTSCAKSSFLFFQTG